MTDFNLKDFILTEDELHEIKTKKKESNQIAYAILFKAFKHYKKFPNKDDTLLEEILISIKSQLNITKKICIKWESRTIERFRGEVRQLFGYRVIEQADKDHLSAHMKHFIFPKGMNWEQIEEACLVYFEHFKIVPLSGSQQTRLLKSSYADFEADLFNQIAQSLSHETKCLLDKLLTEETQELATIKFFDFKNNKAYLNKASILHEIEKYKFLQSFGIPDITKEIGSEKLLQKYCDRILVESPSHIRAHSKAQRYAMLASFCIIKRQEILDTLADLVIKLINNLYKKAERHVDKYILSEVKRVDGKFDILLRLVVASLHNPLSTIKDRIYKEVPETLLQELFLDLQHRGDRWFKKAVTSKALSLFKYGNRNMIWSILNILPFNTDQEKYSDVLKALEWAKKPTDIKNKSIPFEHLFNSQWLSFIEVEQEDEVIKINENAYELAIFERLSKELTVKNIYIDNSYRYRDPKSDLPDDFNENRAHYFDLLNLPKNEIDFVNNLETELNNSLKELNDTILHNEKVKIEKRKNKGSIKLSPYTPQQEPSNLATLQKKISEHWGSTSLMDIMKETDLHINFTKHLKSVSSSERIKVDELKRRKLLCLYGLGTNTGLKRIASGQVNDTVSDLHYIKLRYIDKQNIRASITDIVNATIKIRDPKIWGKASTGCSCDSKKISVWDQNLLSEWHVRYGGKGVMVYWHVDRKSLVVYSQLKTCSSSEVGSMMKGVLEHDTIMEMDKLYTDTHGQSTVGFAFSHLLGFNLLPRLKNISRQKLYSPSKKESYENLNDIIASDTINWSKIKKYYSDIIQYVAALKNKCVDPSVLLKRLSYDNKDHPVFLALLEIGKAARTIFLCRYLKEEQLRIEIHESLNTVERVNSIMGFIFYGKQGEISTNNTDLQEIGLLSLHLLQACMVYINTLMIQEMLQTHDLNFTKEDLRALSPLIHFHITPYGSFMMDMNTRIPFKSIANENHYDKNTHPRSRKSKTVRQVAA
ncbi:MAG: hypothetical protein COY39_03215 [Alphaproteobacteria bacterium CG_4_10_14_0_8_um_filter_37_21]|uniref:Tn3 family transposase n=1 Tax=Candidatus Magasanikbacteria bacterium CG_4_10_14_0_2_um_filter_33_14 TaxID=1974636 RepID=A0A2M7V8M4_9BACT|nr:MAG: hypothetical protein COY39_03215 [Alphaproteobacteria bacterium CG_4_10_14_0_8_um_filter_37_21]PIZ95174.1 MAG: hypothetical protein COX80_04945 [Candidatus Magasanikbacteria bacterium CG_4_10_14_0_2_um_filter_33_14]